MGEQYDTNRFVIRERYKFCADLKGRLGELIQELASRIWHDAVTCDFQSIKDPLDEAMRTRFIWSVDNEEDLKALFKLWDDELTFARARTHQKRSRISCYWRDRVAGVGRMIILVKIAHTLMISATTARRRHIWNQFACQTENETMESDACESWIQLRQWGDQYLHFTSRLASGGTGLIWKLTLEPMILCAASKPELKLGSQNFNQ